MEVTPQVLVRHIVDQYKELPENKRLLIAVAGPPGSGKSTLAYPLTDALNALILHHPPPNPSHLEEPASNLLAESSDQHGQGDEVAIAVGLDGWHHTRAELDAFPDPVEAHWRRGAAFTFNRPSYQAFLSQLRVPLTPEPPAAIPFPTFDHALKDPAISPQPILPRHRIIVIEGLYTMLDEPGWSETAEMMDVRIWVDVDEEVARKRLVDRNLAAGIVDTREKCEARVDASDMKNGEHVRSRLVQPSYTFTSIEGQPFTSETFRLTA
ncbi:hypothetical protein L198_05140 [Cryptococcus wingfieldii CBS 7118]|uniref:Phosphoribulokinase/uridine kinase domain-containing protein n=1 Tax=Cryptococcus wingfieldii CBS 7118 TaxID=1295528 RepID=A0A1E3J0B8_9TREE|nr:hypothetical protein L198_05140 [Cryptococcus wingfieldii CBS 7118]ODN94284.1 hypothetical protein L198_05140 [Cryptococcus wingfieldii CBS 7118]